MDTPIPQNLPTITPEPEPLVARRKGVFRRVFWWTFAIIALIVLVCLAILEQVFSFRGNLYLLAFQKSESPLMIDTNEGWKSVANASPRELTAALELLYQKPGVTIHQLPLQREAVSPEQKAANLLLPSKLHIFTFLPQEFSFEVEVSANDLFQPTSAALMREQRNLVFTINANFFAPDEKPLGLVIHQGKELNPLFPHWSGFFFVRDGKPYFGPRSLFEKIPGITTEAVQVYPSIMTNHQVFPYVELQPDRHFNGDKITYRSLAGMKKDGSIVFVASGKGGVLNVSEIATIASHLNLQHATMMDGGRALQYDFRMDGFSLSFHSFNNTVTLPWEDFDKVVCPVFIGVKETPFEPKNRNHKESHPISPSPEQ